MTRVSSVAPRKRGDFTSLRHPPPPYSPHFPSTPQSRLQTQLMTLKTEIDEAKAQGTQMGAENGALTGVLGAQGVGWEEPKDSWLRKSMHRCKRNLNDTQTRMKS